MSGNFCPVAGAAEIISRKWALIVIHTLLEGPLGFNELKRGIDGLSSKTLSNSLSYLSDEGIIDRRVFQNSPIRVEYSLTDKGEALNPLLTEMRQWGTTWIK